eukprot:Clim_evm7s245 gene=Clim_evmTU7s245
MSLVASSICFFLAGLGKLVPGLVGIISPTARLCEIYGIPATQSQLDSASQHLGPILRHRGILLAIVGCTLIYQAAYNTPATRSLTTAIGVVSAATFVALVPPTESAPAKLRPVSFGDSLITCAIIAGFCLA